MSFGRQRPGAARMRSGRMRRVDEAMRAVLSDAIGKDLKDPRIGFVTVTGVKTSPDLRHARVYVSVLGTDAERQSSIDGLRSAHGFLQRRLADELTLKHTPSLSFHYDVSVDRGMRISSLLDELEQDAHSSPQRGDDGVTANDGSGGSDARQGRGDGNGH
jgi:ribosome-binding factor A